MTTLRVRFAAPPVSDRAEPWGLYDSAGVCVRTGFDRADGWPTADRSEAVIAASQVRIATVKLPPMPASRIAGAAEFALEDQLAGAPICARRSARAFRPPDGRAR